MSWSSLTGASKTAVITAILGFIISFTSTSTSNVGGQVSCSHMDFGALLFGAIALIAGGSGLMNAKSLPDDTRTLNLGLCAVGAAVGILHILRGLGMVGGPCAGL